MSRKNSGDEVDLTGTRGQRGDSANLTKRPATYSVDKGQAAKISDRSEGLRHAISALPRDVRGLVDPEALVDEERLTSLSQAVERLMMEGLGTGADIAFEHAVNALFAEYADDLGLDEHELSRARSLMLDEVRSVVGDDDIRPWSPDEPAPALLDLDAAIEALQARVLSRRRLLLQASGDLSRVLAELTVDAQQGGDHETGALGDFLEKFGEAVRARSSKSIRDDARDRLFEKDPFAPPAPDAREWGMAFLEKLAAN